MDANSRFSAHVGETMIYWLYATELRLSNRSEACGIKAKDDLDDLRDFRDHVNSPRVATLCSELILECERAQIARLSVAS